MPPKKGTYDYKEICNLAYLDVVWSHDKVVHHTGVLPLV